MSDAKRSMQKALRSILCPEIRRRGFKGAFPNLRRLGKNRYDLLSIYFMPYGGGFVVELAKCTPAEFQELQTRHKGVVPDKLCVGHLANRFRLNPNNPPFDHHFKFEPSYLDVPPSQRKAQSLEYYGEIAASIVPLLDSQAEPWFNAL